MIALIHDLIFASKVTATARSIGVEVVIVRDADKLAGKDGHQLIVDLNQPGALEAAVLWKAAGEKQGENRRVIGFASHVDTDTIARARANGIDQVLPRSRFVQQLPELLAN